MRRIICLLLLCCLVFCNCSNERDEPFYPIVGDWRCDWKWTHEDDGDTGMDSDDLRINLYAYIKIRGVEYWGVHGESCIQEDDEGYCSITNYCYCVLNDEYQWSEEDGYKYFILVQTGSDWGITRIGRFYLNLVDDNKLVGLRYDSDVLFGDDPIPDPCTCYRQSNYIVKEVM